MFRCRAQSVRIQGSHRQIARIANQAWNVFMQTALGFVPLGRIAWEAQDPV
jgi:hypothetical protein